MQLAESARHGRQTAGLMQYELEDGSSAEECQLNCYLPKGVAGKDVELSYDVDSLQAKGCICIHFDTQAQALGCVELEGYAFPGEIHAKFSKKQGKYTFRLLRQSVPKPVESSDDEDRDSTADQDVHVQDHFSDAASSGPCTPTSIDQSTDAQQSQQQQDREAQQPGEHASQQDSNGDIREGHPQLLASLSEAAETQQGSSKAGSAAAAADDDEEEDVDDDDAADGDDDQTAGAEQDAAAKKPKKRRGQRKKKKKKSKAAEAAEEDARVADSSVPSEAAAAGAANAEMAAPPAAGAADEEDEFVDAMSEGADDAAESSDQQTTAVSPREKGSRSSRASAGTAPAAVVTISTDDYLSCFSDEPVAGTTQLPTPGGEPLLLPGSLKQGPTVAACLDKHEVKGEDKGLKVIGATWTPSGSRASASFSAFGIFDGHGGKSAATFGSKELLPTVTRLLDRCTGPLPATPRAGAPKLGRLPSEAVAAAAAAGDDPDDDRDWGITVTDEDQEVWAAQEALVDRLPQAMFAGFLEADKTCQGKFKASGTTATLAIVTGWDLVVANVGDSLAFLDTGREVIALSGNHRIDDSPAERARIEAAGGEIAKSTVDGKPVGPDRVWPGGLAMSRTIGDPQATHVIAAPEIRHVTLPTTGGRLVIASDGVWDHMQPKSMIHQVRNDNTDAAAKKISVAAMKKKGLRDDISVLVVDLLPAAGDPRPPALLPGPVREAVEPVQIIWPLTEESSSPALDVSRGVSAGGLTTATSITSVTAISNSHWRDNAASRRTVALQLLRRQARQEAEAAAAEAARLARLAAEAEAQAKNSNLSDTYRELAQLRIDPSIVVEEVKQHQQQLEAQEVAAQEAAAAPATTAEEEEGWTTVGGGSSNADSGNGNGFVSFEQQMQAAVRGGRAGRGDRGGRSRGRGREHFARGNQQPEDLRPQEQQQQQHDQQGADASNEGGYVRDSNGYGGRGRGGRGRGRGRRSSHLEGQQGSQPERQQGDQLAGDQDTQVASRAAAAAADAIDKVRVVPRPRRASLDARNHKQQQQQQQQQLDDGGARQEQQQVLPTAEYVHVNAHRGPVANGGAHYAEDEQQGRQMHGHPGPGRGRGRGRGRFGSSKLDPGHGEAAASGSAADASGGYVDHDVQQSRQPAGRGSGFRGGRRGSGGYRPGGRGPAGYDGSYPVAAQNGNEVQYEAAPPAADNGAAAAGSDYQPSTRVGADGRHERGRGGRGGYRGRGHGGSFESGRSGDHPSNDRFRGSERGGGYRGGRGFRGGRGRGEAGATASSADHAPAAHHDQL